MGAGAVIAALAADVSPEAAAAHAAFQTARADLPGFLAACGSGRELAARGYADDVAFAAAHDVSKMAPRLRDGAFTGEAGR